MVNKKLNIENLIEDAKNALEHESYFSALALTFALVAECSVLQYPDIKSERERFKLWIDQWESIQWANNEECRLSNFGTMPALNGELLYQLRCNLFHEASINIDFNDDKKIKDVGNKRIRKDLFTLSLDKNNSMHIHYDCSMATFSGGYSSLNINVNGLIYKLLNLVEVFYKNNKENYCFNNIRVFDNRS